MDVMRKFASLLLMALAPLAAADKGFTSLFNGKDLTGWKVNENTATFSVKDGAIVAHGNRSHCFYVGAFNKHTFKDFELRVDVMTEPGSNGGIYIDTAFQEQGWPSQGFEIQVNNSFVKDPRRTGSLYQVQDVGEEVVNKILKDNVWYTETIIKKGNNIKVKLNDQQVVDWTQPADWNGVQGSPGRKIQPGTIALQGHDPGSTVHYKNIRIKLLK
jgi:hypothetical protein